MVLKNQPRAGYFEVDPLTRATDRISIHATIDFDNRRVIKARVEKKSLLGIESILIGRPPADAVHLAGRVSNSGTGANTIASVLALEMALGVVPPPLACITRGLGAAAELLAAHTRHLFIQGGPDYSEATVSRLSRSMWAIAQRKPASGTHFHGYKTIAEIMTGMNPLHGDLYRESLSLTRTACEVATLVFGKYPHPSAIFPGGVGIEADKEIFNQVLGRINLLIDYAKKVTSVWDDLVEFFYEVEPRYREVGRLPANLISMGMWDDPGSYDARFDKCSEWGERRLITPGVIVNGKLRTTRLVELTLGRHTWTTAPHWNNELVESGPLARQWISAVGGKLKNEFIQTYRNKSNGAGLEIDLPKFRLPSTRLRWRIPEEPNALERTRARAYHIGYCSVIALTYLLKAFDCLQRRDLAMSRKYRVPEDAFGTGFWEDSRGALCHHLVIRDGRISDYQISPSAWAPSKGSPTGVPGPFEQAIANTPLLEEFSNPEDFTGIDLLRAIRSFDP